MAASKNVGRKLESFLWKENGGFFEKRTDGFTYCCVVAGDGDGCIITKLLKNREAGYNKLLQYTILQLKIFAYTRIILYYFKIGTFILESTILQLK